MIAAGVPILSGEAGFRGMVAGMFQLGSQGHSVLYRSFREIHLRAEAGTYLLDGAGRTIYCCNGDQKGQSLADQGHVPPAVGRSRPGAVRTRDQKGEQIVVSHAQVPDTQWVLIQEESWADLLQISARYRRRLWEVLAVGLLIPSVVAAAGMRRITRPITELTSAANKMAEGEIGQVIHLQTGDELADLASAFNRMSAHLQALYASLERRLVYRRASPPMSQ